MFDVLTPETTKVGFFWHVQPRQLVNKLRRFSIYTYTHIKGMSSAREVCIEVVLITNDSVASKISKPTRLDDASIRVRNPEVGGKVLHSLQTNSEANQPHIQRVLRIT
jgi:hypothetical protein